MTICYNVHKEQIIIYCIIQQIQTIYNSEMNKQTQALCVNIVLNNMQLKCILE